MPVPTIALRPFPYPYRAMLAICSDLDETPDRRVYWEIMRFLNTTETTSMGPGLGLEVGNTIYFDMRPDQFAYWNTDDAGRAMVRDLIRSGHIDCLHSFGDLATSRAHAGRALDELDRHDCRLQVWVDHGTAVTNFGADRMCGHGDEPGHAAYHADLTLSAGVQYVWCGRVTSVIGQDRPTSLGGIFDAGHPMASARTIAKEAVKHVVGRLGNRKYQPHVGNRLTRPSALRDGQPVIEFMRSNPHWGGVSSCDQGRAIEHVLTQSFLDRLVEREAYCILYTHLGKVHSPQAPFSPAGVAAFRRLAEAHHGGRILVTTTRRLLDYHQLRAELRFAPAGTDTGCTIDLHPGQTPFSATTPVRPNDLAGLCFDVACADNVSIRIAGRAIEHLQRHPVDNRGRVTVSVPWSRLAFPVQHRRATNGA